MTDILTQVCQGDNSRVSVPWWMMTDNGRMKDSDRITYNGNDNHGGWKTIGNNRQWGMTIQLGKCQIMDDYRHWWMTNNGEWPAMTGLVLPHRQWIHKCNVRALCGGDDHKKKNKIADHYLREKIRSLIKHCGSHC